MPKDIFDAIFSDEPVDVEEKFVNIDTYKHKPKESNKFIDNLDELLKLYDQLLYACENENKAKVKFCEKKFTNMYKYMVHKYGDDNL